MKLIHVFMVIVVFDSVALLLNFYFDYRKDKKNGRQHKH
jgi:4-hydroxybenzoate polyprenyltransferase